MSSSNSIGQLYGAVSRLSYSESKLAATLRLTQLQSDMASRPAYVAYGESKLAETPAKPAELTNASRLLKQSNKLAELGVSLRDRNPETLTQAAIDNALTAVSAAQEGFDMINLSAASVITVESISSAVDTAIDSIAIALK